MRLLVLGGTVFLSKAVAAEAVARGHEVVCACRGESGAVPEGARLVRWDRGAGDPWAADDGDRAESAIYDILWETEPGLLGRSLKLRGLVRRAGVSGDGQRRLDNLWKGV